MDQTHGLNFRALGRRYAVNPLVIAIGVVLAAISGWYISGLLLSEPSAFQRILSTILLPLFIASGVVVLEIGRAIVPGPSHLAFDRRALGPFGSVATGYVLPKQSGNEFRHEIRGLILPLITSAITSIFAWLAPEETTIRLILICLAGSHLAILGLNSLPSFPFVGGALIRSIFWHLHDNHVSGTRAAFIYGQFIAAALVGFGLYFLTWHTEYLVPGLWGLFAGAVIIHASRDEMRRANVIKRAAEVNASDAIEGLNPTIRAAAPLTEAIDILMEQNTNGPGLVRDRAEYAGMITLDRIREIPRAKWDDLTTADATIPFSSLHEATPEASLLDIFHMLTMNEATTIVIRRDNRRIVGLIDQSIDPRLLVRRGIMRNLDLIKSARTPDGGPKAS